jgi:hypothetical protein
MGWFRFFIAGIAGEFFNRSIHRHTPNYSGNIGRLLSQRTGERIAWLVRFSIAPLGIKEANEKIRLYCSILVSPHSARLPELASCAGIDKTFGFLGLVP